MPPKGVKRSPVEVVYLFDLPFCINRYGGKPARPMVVQIGIEVHPVKLIDRHGMLLCNMHAPHMFADD